MLEKKRARTSPSAALSLQAGPSRWWGSSTGVLIVQKVNAMFILLKRPHHVATRQIQMSRIRREAEQLRIGHRHEPVNLFLRLHHLPHVVVQACRESHLAGQFANLVAPLAQLFEGGRSVGSRFVRFGENTTR